ncbi:MAG TPA: GGDEF domain-containing protein [Solirubrobacterales bacterium]|nr:GGDEF domain-containing protein [Solirubrobacterales bacterium]
MPSRGWLAYAWKRNGLAPAVRTLSLITFAGAASSLVAALFPSSPSAPVELFRLVAGLAFACSLLLWWLADRIPRWFLHAAVAGGTLAISVLIARAATGVSTVVTATDYIWMGVYVSFFFSRTAARLHLALIAAAFGVALLVNAHNVPAEAFVLMTASIIVAAETIGRQSNRLRHEAHTDALTGLLNRKGLLQAAERAFSLADRTGIPLTVGLVDLDDFKQVNDRDGHAAGDRLLVQMARTWSEELQPGDIFARLGGDEFLVILVGSGDEEAARFFERLLFISPTQWSAGVIKRHANEDLSACLARADNTLYEAKRSRTEQRQPLSPEQPTEPEFRLEPAR